MESHPFPNFKSAFEYWNPPHHLSEYSYPSTLSKSQNDLLIPREVLHGTHEVTQDSALKNRAINSNPFGSLTNVEIKFRPFVNQEEMIDRKYSDFDIEKQISNSNIAEKILDDKEDDYIDNFVKNINDQLHLFSKNARSSSSLILEMQKKLDEANLQIERMKGENSKRQQTERELTDKLSQEAYAWKKKTEDLQLAFDRLSGNNLEPLKHEELERILEHQKIALSKVEKAIVNKVERLKEEKLCQICIENDKNMLFLPCKHFKVCDVCTTRDMKLCPFCNTRIESFIKLFP